MIPQTQPRKVKNSGKVNLLISFIFHAVLVIVLFYFAAREGLLGKKLEKISVELVKKEKPPEKVKPPEPKVEPPKVETPKLETPKMVETPKASAPPSAAPPVVAPANNELPSFEFDGGKAVETSSDPVQLYKGFIEYSLRSKWDRPEDLDDDNFVAEVDVAVAKDGKISDPQWQKNSGNARWDKSVREALAAVPKVDRSPPTNFPPRVVIRFDVQLESEPVIQ
jgi:hypothetical protein